MRCVVFLVLLVAAAAACGSTENECAAPPCAHPTPAEACGELADAVASQFTRCELGTSGAGYNLVVAGAAGAGCNAALEVLELPDECVDRLATSCALEDAKACAELVVFP